MSRHWWRCYLALTRMECLRMLRTREVWTRMLAPSLLFPLAMLAMIVAILMIVTGSDHGRVVAISPDTPAELPIATELIADGWVVQVVDNPKAAVRAGDADLGLGPWRSGYGLATRTTERVAPIDTDFARLGLTKADQYLWTVQVWDSEATEDDRLSALDDVEDAVFEAVVASHGLDADGMEWPLKLVRVDTKDDSQEGGSGGVFDDLPTVMGHSVGPLDMVQLFAAVMSAALGLQLLALGPVADRTEGIFETLATSAAPGRAVLAARATASVCVLWVAAALMCVPVAGIVVQLEDAPFTVLEATGYLTGAVVFCAGTYLPVGTLSRSIQDANALGAYAGGLAMTGGLALVVLPLWAALAVSLGWMTLWIVGLGSTDALSKPPKADAP